MTFLSRVKEKYTILRKVSSFLYFIVKNNIFKFDASTVILKIIGKLVYLEYPNFKDNVCYRTPKDSADLFNALIKVYLKDKSNKTLEQLIVVLRDEIINRG